MNKKTILAVALLAGIAVIPFSAGGNHISLREWDTFSRTHEARILVAWIKNLARAELLGEKFTAPMPEAHPSFYGRLGVFITLMKKGKVRGCYGSFHPSTPDLSRLLKDSVRGALRRDWRYRPPDISEADEVSVILTIASPPHPTEDIHGIDLAATGVVLRCQDEETIVLVPAEMKTKISIENTAKRRNCQLEVFSAVTLR